MDSTFVFWYGQFSHLHTVPFSPSWFKAVLQSSCQSRQLHFYGFCHFFSVLFFFFIFRFLNRIATVEHIKDYKYRALLSWSLGSFKYKLHLKGIHFVGLGSLWASNCLFLLLFSTSSSPADVPRCCSKRQNEIASNLSSDLIVRDHSL